MKSTLTTPRVAKLLTKLYADARRKDPIARKKIQLSGQSGSEMEHYRQHTGYMAVGPELGRLLYSLVRSGKAKTIVEFGTSYGVSAIHLAAGLRDNGGGKLITTEFVPEKAAVAKKNLTSAGLEDLVEFRIGDALESLAKGPRKIDMIFLDGAKGMYISVLKLLEPHLRSGGIIVSDNTNHDGMKSFLTYIRNPRNGFTSAPIFTDAEGNRAHEVTIKN